MFFLWVMRVYLKSVVEDFLWGSNILRSPNLIFKVCYKKFCNKKLPEPFKIRTFLLELREDILNTLNSFFKRLMTYKNFV